MDINVVKMMNNRACNFCGSTEYEERKAEYIYRRGGKYLIVRDVPCEVCLNCGERYYPGTVLLRTERRFNDIHKQHAHPMQMIQVPIEAYA